MRGKRMPSGVSTFVILRKAKDPATARTSHAASMHSHCNAHRTIRMPVFTPADAGNAGSFTAFRKTEIQGMRQVQPLAT